MNDIYYQDKTIEAQEQDLIFNKGNTDPQLLADYRRRLSWDAGHPITSNHPQQQQQYRDVSLFIDQNKEIIIGAAFIAFLILFRK